MAEIDDPMAAASEPIIAGIVAAEAAQPASVIAGQPLLTVQGLKKHFPIYGGVMRRQIGTVYAVDGVDFEIMPGETFSLVGESGCGKTTLGRTVIQLTPSTDGRVVFDGYELADVDPDDMRPLRRRMQIIFQDPFGSLNPRMPVSDIIGEGLLAQGLNDRAARDKRVEDSLELVGLRREYSRRYPHEFSGGQRQRIGVARALALGPDFIVADEPVSALDVSIQSQVLNLLLDLKRELNLTYLFISHNLQVVQYFSDRVGVMYLGKIAEIGSVDQLYHDPRHPYTVALLSAIPDANPRRRKSRVVLKGDVPSPAAPPSGCRFHTRCWLRERLGNPENCSTIEPQLRPFGQEGHQVACHWAEDLSAATVSQAAAETPGDRRGGRRRRVSPSPRPAGRARLATVPAAIPARSWSPRCSWARAAPRPAPRPPRRASTAASPPLTPPASVGPVGRAQAPQPSATAWPGGVVEAIVVLGAADQDIQTAGGDLGTAVNNQDLEAMWGAADGLATMLEQLPAQVDRIRGYPAMAALAAAYDAALPDMIGGAKDLRDAITDENAAGITAGSQRLSNGLKAYAAVRPILAPLVEQGFLMQRLLVK